jgi:hypothetical protein
MSCHVVLAWQTTQEGHYGVARPGLADPGVVGGDGAALMDIARATDKNQVLGTRHNQSVVLLLS